MKDLYVSQRRFVHADCCSVESSAVEDEECGCKQRFIKGKRVARTLPLIYHGKGEQWEGAGGEAGGKKEEN